MIFAAVEVVDWSLVARKEGWTPFKYRRPIKLKTLPSYTPAREKWGERAQAFMARQPDFPIISTFSLATDQGAEVVCLLPRPDYEWPAGNIQMIGKSNAEAMKGEEPRLTKLAPHFSLAEVAQHALDFWLTTEELPKPEDRVTIDGEANVHLAYHSTNDQEADRLYGGVEEDPEPPRAGSAPRPAEELLYAHGHLGRWGRSSGGYLPVRHRSGHVGARHELQGS